MAVLAVALSSAAGGFAYFLPAVQEAFDATSQVIVLPTPTPTPSPSSTGADKQTTRPPDASTVLLLASDKEADSLGDHIVTHCMITVGLNPASKRVTVRATPLDPWATVAPGLRRPIPCRL